MPSETSNPADALRNLIAEGHLSEESLQSITAIEPQKLRLFLEETRPASTILTTQPQALSADESHRLSALAAQLTEGLAIDDDERLQGILESLTIECHLTLESIARLTGGDRADLEQVIRDPRALPAEKKYSLALRGSYLINAVSRARPVTAFSTPTAP